MHPKPFPDTTQSLLAEAARVGVAYDFCLLGLAPAEADAAHLHSSNDADKTWRAPEEDHRYTLSRTAAVKGMELFSQRLAVMRAKSSIAYSVDGAPRGEPISLNTLLGPEWCHSLRRLALNGKLAPAVSEEDQATASRYYEDWHHARGYEVGEGPRGFTGAFFTPPYGLRTGDVKTRELKPGGGANHGPWKEIIVQYPDQSGLEQLFANLAGKLFYDFQEPVRCYQWSDDWSTYFDAGREWWGTSYWTILALEREEILVIGASASD